MESEADIESEGDSSSNAEAGVLPKVIEFLDHFDVSLDVVVRCARKTEMARWKRLFDIVGNPLALFEVSTILPIGSVLKLINELIRLAYL